MMLIKRRTSAVTVIAAGFAVVLSVGLAGCEPAVETPETWRPVKLGQKDFFAAMHPGVRDFRNMPDEAAYRSLFMRLGGWAEAVGFNDILWFNVPMPEEKKFKRLPFNVWDTMGPDYTWSRKRDDVKWFAANRPDVYYTLGVHDAWFPWFMKDKYDCDIAHFRTWRKEFPNFVGFDVMNEGLFEITHETDPSSGAYSRVTNTAMRAACELAFPPQTNYAGRIRNWFPKARSRLNAMLFNSDEFCKLCVNDAKSLHQCAMNGFKLTLYECDQQVTSAPWQLAMCHARGMTRQFSIPCLWYMANLFGGNDRAGNRVAGEWRCPRKGFDNHMNRGSARSLGTRNYFYGYFAGLNGIELEQADQCFYDNRAEGVEKPTVYYRDFNAVMDLAERQSRGVTWTPVAALTSVYEGFIINGYNYADCRDCFAPNAFFFTLVTPRGVDGYQVVDRKKGEVGCLYNSEFGEICDVLVPDAHQSDGAFARALAPYKVAFLIGDFPYREDYELDAIRDWVRKGGILVCSEDAVANGFVTSEMTGVTFGGAAVPSGQKLLAAGGAEIDVLADRYTLYAGAPTTAKPYLKDESGTVAVWQNAFGKGRVTTIAAYQALPDRHIHFKKSAEHPNWFWHIQRDISTGKTVFPIYRHLLRQARDAFVPVTVKGDVQWGVNRLDDGQWIVWMMNNKGVIHFQGESEERDRSKTAQVTVAEKATGRTRTLTLEPGVCCVVRFDGTPQQFLESCPDTDPANAQ